MIEGRSVLALIPARGGSKRLPGKNLLPLAGRPLIAWSIEDARAVPGIDDVLVSTDDAAIAEAARQHGASVPWLRPAELASDQASSNDVVLHALAQCALAGHAYDIVLLLQPTSPFRDLAKIREALAQCVRHGGEPVVAMAPARSHPAWCFHVREDGTMQPVLDGAGVHRRSQDLAPAFEISGNLYAMGVSQFQAARSFFTPRTRALVIDDPMQAVDIDDDFDWLVAQAVATQRKRAS